MYRKIIGLTVLVLIQSSCTDLDVQVYDKQANFWRTPAEVEAGVASAYVWLREYTSNPYQSLYILNELSTDEIIAPNRLNDWQDDGEWEELWKHRWHHTSKTMTGGWTFVFTGIGRINSILENLKHADTAIVNAPPLVAELKTLRAFYQYTGMDLFGNVPIVNDGTIQLSDLSNTIGESSFGNNRNSVFAAIEKELLSNLPLLSQSVGDETYGRVTYWFAKSLLAKLYLNAEVYTGTARWSDCIAACDEIIQSNSFQLEENFFRNFAIDNHYSAENIFSIPYDAGGELHHFGIQDMTLHWLSSSTFGLQGTGAWNAYCSTQEFVDLFPANDKRKRMFLIGQQYTNSKQYEDVVADPSRAQYLDDGVTPLDFDPVITAFNVLPPKTEVAGARCAKWEFNTVTGTFGAMSNDFVMYRLADIILMKAEAQLRNADASGALATLNRIYGSFSIRSRANQPDFTPGEITLDSLLKERARELAWEGHRRNDLIRFGHFLDARIPEKEVSETFRLLYPIPESELAKNHYLKQNPGY